jgi:carboxylesterase type B
LASCNAGFLDQRQSLVCVQANIVHFGGDPSKVTIFGWSAGGTSVDNLVTTTLKDSPFRAAIIESGQNTYGNYFPKGVGITAWQSLIEALNCSAVRDALACVRAADAMKIKEIIEVASLCFIPTVDNITQLANPSQARSERRIANVPLMIGTNAQEGRTGVGLNNLTAFLQTFFPDKPKLRRDIAATYPIGQGGLNTEYDIISQISTDFVH